MRICLSHRWQLLSLSLLISLGIHAALLALLHAFETNSPPQLRLRFGDLCFDVDVVAMGEPSLGSGLGGAGDGPGDGLPAAAALPAVLRVDAENHEPRSTDDDVLAVESTLELAADVPAPAPAQTFIDPPMPEPGAEISSSAPASSGPPRSPTDAATSSSVSNRPSPVASSESAAGTGQPAGAASTGGTIGVRSGARLAGQKPPDYPLEAQRRGLEGEVVLALKVSADGTVAEAKLHRSCGHDLLDNAALHWSESLHFIPARQDGQAVSADVLLPVRYRLRDGTRRR